MSNAYNVQTYYNGAELKSFNVQTFLKIVIYPAVHSSGSQQWNSYQANSSQYQLVPASLYPMHQQLQAQWTLKFATHDVLHLSTSDLKLIIIIIFNKHSIIHIKL